MPDKPRHRGSARRRHARRRRRVRRAAPRATPRAAADRVGPRRSRPARPGRPPCAPTPGTRTGPPRALRSGGRQRGADDDADRTGLGRSVAVDGGRGIDDRLRDGAAVGLGPLDARTLRVGRGGQDEHAAAVGSWRCPTAAAGSRIRDTAMRSPRRRPAATHPPRRGVGRHRGADVAALGVGQHQHARSRSAAMVRSSTANPQRRTPRRTPPGA